MAGDHDDERLFPTFDQRRAELLAALKIDLLLDVGANIGQYAKTVRQHGYEGDLVSFEPMQAAHEQLCRAAAADARWRVAPPMALGAAAGVTSINIAGNSISSSLLPMLDQHVRASPDSAYIGSERVEVRTLDDVANGDLVDTSRRLFLKIDTQGYEQEILNGSEQTLRLVLGVEIELSLALLYAGQPSAWELIGWLQDVGFACFGVRPGFSDSATLRMLQMDALFLRQELLL